MFNRTILISAFTQTNHTNKQLIFGKGSYIGLYAIIMGGWLYFSFTAKFPKTYHVRYGRSFENNLYSMDLA